MVIITDPKANSSLRSSAISALSSLAHAKPQAVASDMWQSLILIITDPNMNVKLRNDARYALSSLIEAKPQVVSSEMWQALMAVVTDSKADTELRFQCDIYAIIPNSSRARGGYLRHVASVYGYHHQLKGRY